MARVAAEANSFVEAVVGMFWCPVPSVATVPIPSNGNVGGVSPREGLNIVPGRVASKPNILTLLEIL